jgi:hypothetical protein
MKGESDTVSNPGTCRAALRSTDTVPALHTNVLLDLVAPFFVDGLDRPPVVDDDEVALDLMAATGNLLVRSGFPGRALTVFGHHEAAARKLGLLGAPALVASLPLHLGALVRVGRLHDADLLAREVLDLAQRVAGPTSIGRCLVAFAETLLIRGSSDGAAVLVEAGSLLDNDPLRWVAEAHHLLWSDDPSAAAAAGRHALDRMNTVSDSDHTEALWQFAAFPPMALTVTAHGLVGASLSRLGDADAAQHEFTTALRLAEGFGLNDAALPSLLGIAALHAKVGSSVASSTMLQAAFRLIQQGPYRLADADAHRILASVEVQGAPPTSLDTAERALTRAKTLEWCDGPPFSYTRPLHIYT